MSVSHVVRLHGTQPSLLFKWKKHYQEGSLTVVAVGEDVVLGQEDDGVEILKETVEYGQSRKWIAYAPLLPKDKE